MAYFHKVAGRHNPHRRHVITAAAVTFCALMMGILEQVERWEWPFLTWRAPAWLVIYLAGLIAIKLLREHRSIW